MRFVLVVKKDMVIEKGRKVKKNTIPRKFIVRRNTSLNQISGDDKPKSGVQDVPKAR